MLQLEMRKKEFALLMTCLHDLQQLLEGSGGSSTSATCTLIEGEGGEEEFIVRDDMDNTTDTADTL